MHIILDDVKLVTPVEVRNGVIGIYMHMLSAFTGPPKPFTTKRNMEILQAQNIEKETQIEKINEETS